MKIRFARSRIFLSMTITAVPVVVACVTLHSFIRYESYGCDYQIDYRFSDAYYHTIVSELKKAPVDNPHKLLKQVKQLTGIGACECRFTNRSVLELEICADEPLCLLNNDKIITTSGTVLDAALFQPYIIQRLACITTSPAVIPSVPFINWLDLLSAEVFQRYAIHYDNDFSITLTDKNDANWCIRYTTSIVPTTQHIAWLDTIKQQLVSATSGRYNNRCTWVADIRFENQIIVQEIKRRTSHGSCILS